MRRIATLIRVIRGVTAVTCIAVLSGARAEAQAPQDFSHLKLKTGDLVFVTDSRTGVSVSGPLTTLAPAELFVGGHAFKPTPELKIERPGDPIWTGAAVGFGAGLLFGAIFVVPECSRPLSKRYCLFQPAVSLASLGAFVDWLHKGRTRIYPAR